MTTMKAISVWQPHAWLFGRGKIYETRTWSTDYRGLIAIHASKTQQDCEDVERAISHCNKHGWPDNGYHFTRAFHQVFGAHLKVNSIPTKGLRLGTYLPFGCIVAVGRLAAVYRAPELWKTLTPPASHFGDFGQGRYAWWITDVSILATPVPLRGQQGLWDLPQHIVEEVVRAQEPRE